jgi:hypothetical protein
MSGTHQAEAAVGQANDDDLWDAFNDLEYAIYDLAPCPTATADFAVETTVKHLRRDPRFANIKTADFEWLLRHLRIDLEDNLSRDIDELQHSAERAARAIKRAIGFEG